MMQRIVKTKPMGFIKIIGGRFKLSYMKRAHITVSFHKMRWLNHFYDNGESIVYTPNIKEIKIEDAPHSMSDVKYCFPGLNRYKYDNRTRLSEYKPLC